MKRFYINEKLQVNKDYYIEANAKMEFNPLDESKYIISKEIKYQFLIK